MTQQSVLEAALALPHNERIQLVDCLLESLGLESDGVDKQGFLAEIGRRSTEIDQGTAELIPWSELKDEPS